MKKIISWCGVFLTLNGYMMIVFNEDWIAMLSIGLGLIFYIMGIEQSQENTKPVNNIPEDENTEN